MLLKHDRIHYTCALVTVILSACAYHIPLEPMESPESIVGYIRNNVAFTYDWDSEKPGIDRWQSPKETLELGTGDCEDGCILFMFLVNREFGWRPDIVLVLVDGNPLMGHYIVHWQGKYYDPINGQSSGELPYYWSEILRVDYTLAMAWATRLYTKSVL